MTFIEEMIIKIKTAAIAKVSSQLSHETAKVINNNVISANEKIIAIGASTGGTEAIYNNP